MKVKDLRCLLSSNQQIALVNKKGHFFCYGENGSMSNEYDDAEVTHLEGGNGPYQGYCVFAYVDKEENAK